ncbi:PEGA domain-containing protein [Methanolobus psychrotolerans]|uniref:PEGA domain-containing protein n=1 Tax=Methanolobus psychrotolerans TaxID=1874706 RepID=UPI000B916D06|nr:PEGA domain-containing protein [Methanolobus psychrotolerans]
MLVIQCSKTTLPLNVGRTALILLILLFMSSPAHAGTPVVVTQIGFTPALYPGGSATLSVLVSEVGGNDWVKDVTVSVQVSPSSGVAGGSVSQGISRIGTSSSKSFYFPIELSDTATPGTRTIAVTVKYYEMDLFNINTFGPYYIHDQQFFTINNPYGQIAVSTTPPDVDIYLDGKYVGRSPMTISSVMKGKHTVLLKKDGYNDLSTSVDVTADSQSSLSKELSQKTGSVSISTDPRSASISIDGRYTGVSPLTLDALIPGSHTIALSMNGYRDVSDSFYINAGTSTTYSMVLVKKNGNIDIDSAPSGASVYLAGTYKGVTPMYIENIPPETYNIRLIKEGYKDLDRTVTVKDGATASVSVSMDRLSLSEKVTATVSGGSASSSSIYSSSSSSTNASSGISSQLPGIMIVALIILIFIKFLSRSAKNMKTKDDGTKAHADGQTVIQNIHYGDRIETHIKDSVVQRSNIGSRITSCPYCGSTMPSEGNFCMACGKRIKYMPK